jgi:hypothetical protein
MWGFFSKCNNLASILNYFAFFIFDINKWHIKCSKKKKKKSVPNVFSVLIFFFLILLYCSRGDHVILKTENKKKTVLAEIASRWLSSRFHKTKQNKKKKTNNYNKTKIMNMMNNN